MTHGKTTSPAGHEAGRETGRFKKWFVRGFGTVIVLGGLYGFGGKILKFILAWAGNEEARFALVPVAMYFVVAFGFACVFLWAILNGMLHDVEGPKYRMLENERELEEIERREERQRWA